MNGKRRPTVADVARMAGVSAATVSRALNNPKIVAEDTAQRILDAVRHYGYVPNMAAGALATNRTRLVMVMVPGLSGSILNEMIEAMTEELTVAQYQVMLALSGYDDRHVADIVSVVLARRPEGVIVTGNIEDTSLRELLVSTGATIIETRNLPRNPIDYVVGFSNHAVGAEIARVFHGMGRRRPFAITSNTARARERLSGFTETMAELGVRSVSTGTYPIPSTFAQGRQALAEMLESGAKVDCIMCGSDWQAHGVLIEAQKRGLRVPDDIAIVGFGNMEFCESTEPGLSSIYVDGRRIGREAAHILIERAAKKTPEPRIMDVGFSLIRRDSA